MKAIVRQDDRLGTGIRIFLAAGLLSGLTACLSLSDMRPDFWNSESEEAETRDVSVTPFPDAPLRAGGGLIDVDVTGSVTAPPELESASSGAPSPDQIMELAAPYRSFAEMVEAVNARPLASSRDVRAALQGLRSFDPEQLAESWVIEGALRAAQDDNFAGGISRERERYGIDGVVRRLSLERNYIRRVPGAENAEATLLQSIEADYRQLSELGDRLLKVARHMQQERWGAPGASLGTGTGSGTGTGTGSGTGTGTTGWNASSASASADRDAPRPLGYGVEDFLATTPAPGSDFTLAHNTLTLAAHITVQGKGEADLDDARHLASNKRVERCLRWAKLNLNQCVASAHYPYEEAYCAGKHAAHEVADCWAMALPQPADYAAVTAAQ